MLLYLAMCLLYRSYRSAGGQVQAPNAHRDAGGAPPDQRWHPLEAGGTVSSTHYCV